MLLSLSCHGLTGLETQFHQVRQFHQYRDRFNAAAEKLAQDAARLESELEAAQVRIQKQQQ